MKTLTTTLVIFLALLSSTQAQQVTEEMATTVARNFFFEKFNQYVHPVEYSTVTIRETLNWVEGDQTLLYIFNMNPAGFVIVSGQQAMTPVVGYSWEHSYRSDNQPPNVRYWIGQYAEQVRVAGDDKMQPSETISGLWNKYVHGDFHVVDGKPLQNSVGPLLTSLWDQGWPYNYYCPETSTGGSGGHVWAGCVATAIAQVVYYWRWPDHGQGTRSYIPGLHPEYGVQSADFENTWYRFDEMADVPSTVNLAIAEYLYHWGVALRMNYGPGGSAPDSSILNPGMDSLYYYFKMFPYTWLYRDSIPDEEWKAILIGWLDKECPVYYGGNVETGEVGHAFVCDGYQDSVFFHFNLGWGGSSNGYYTIDNILGYNYGQIMTSMNVPDTIQFPYPNYASGDDTLTAFEGSMTDGSGPVRDYLNNMHCSWLIDPQTNEDSIISITLNVRRFSTAGPGDRLVIYDGGATSSPVLAELWGDTIPPVLVSSGNQVLVSFSADASGTGPGFLVDYLAEVPDYCQGTVIVTDSSCHIFDGSGRFHYHNSKMCKWRLEPEGCDSSLTLHFTRFDTEPENDYLEIYDLESQELLATYSGHYTEPPPPVTASGGRMFLVFKTNKIITADGWEAWYGDVSGIVTSEMVRDMVIIPNPARETARLDYTLDRTADMQVELISVFGKTVREVYPGRQLAGHHVVEIELRDLPPGVYLCRLRAGEQTVVKRLIKL